MSAHPRVALVGARLADPEAAELRGETLLVEEGSIAGRAAPGDAPGADWKIVDTRGLTIAPGFVDVHFHGTHATARVDALAAALARDARQLLEGGTTAFLATSIARHDEALHGFVSAVAETLASTGTGGATCLGLHMEGPWISPAMPGAMAAECCRPFGASGDAEILDRAEGLLRMVTLAPELDGAPELLAELGRRGVVASLGHSRASQPDIDRAIASGLQHVTHLFNAMGPFHHREPGVPGTVLAEDRLTCDLICDGHHVHPDAVRIAARSLRERLLLISDRLDLPGAVRPAGDDPEAPSRLPNGTIAGSQLRMDRAVDKLQAYAGVGLLDAVAAATLRPARLLGVESERGTLRRGARADLVFLDADGVVVETWMEGRQVWAR